MSCAESCEARIAENALGLGGSNDTRESLELELEDGPPERGHPIVAAAGVVVGGPTRRRRFFQQRRRQHSLNRSVEGPWTHVDLAGCGLFDLLRDRVPVSRSLGEGQEDVEDDRSEGKLGVGVSHGVTISVADVVCKATGARRLTVTAG